MVWGCRTLRDGKLRRFYFQERSMEGRRRIITQRGLQGLLKSERAMIADKRIVEET